MGRPKTPAALKLLRGNPGKKTLTADVNPPAVKEPYQVPAWLSKDARVVWIKVAPELAKLNLLTIVDLEPLAIYCQAVSDVITITKILNKDGPIKGSRKHPAWNARNEAIATVHRYAQEFGFTPGARTKVTGTPQGATDLLDAYLNKKKEKLEPKTSPKKS